MVRFLSKSEEIRTCEGLSFWWQKKGGAEWLPLFILSLTFLPLPQIPLSPPLVKGDRGGFREREGTS